VIVIGVLIGPEACERLVMLGGGITTKLVEADCTPTVTVTETLPAAAPAGTATAMVLLPQELGDPTVVPNLAVPEPAA